LVFGGGLVEVSASAFGFGVEICLFTLKSHIIMIPPAVNLRHTQLITKQVELMLRVRCALSQRSFLFGRKRSFLRRFQQRYTGVVDHHPIEKLALALLRIFEICRWQTGQRHVSGLGEVLSQLGHEVVSPEKVFSPGDFGVEDLLGPLSIMGHNKI
jgi:hypothetical protein